MLNVSEKLTEVMRTDPWGKFQVKGVRFIEGRGGKGIIGDDMGLGKTWQASAVLKLHPEARPAVIACPATIKYKWQRELYRFAGIRSSVLEGFKPFGLKLKIYKEKRGDGRGLLTHRWFNSKEKRKHFVADNFHRIIVKDETIEQEFPVLRDVMIVNYDILADWTDYIVRYHKPKAFIPDEFHWLSNPETQRAGFTEKLVASCDVIVPLSGTPITNRPIEFFPALHMVAPEEFPSYIDYAFAYCAPKKKFRGSGWDYTGASNLEELHERVSKVMIRRMKSDVLTELPTKARSVIPVDIDNRAEYEHARDDFLVWLAGTNGIAAANRARRAEAIVRVGALKRLAAKGKISTVARWLEDWHNDTKEKFVMFGVNTEVVRGFAQLFPGSLVVDGKATAIKKQQSIDSFQHDPAHWLINGNVKSLGEGSTLTASSTVGFLQLGWTPGSRDQCEDRVLRIGQTSDKMNSLIFIGRDTVDEAHLDLLDSKAAIIGQVLDGDEAELIQYQLIDDMLLQYQQGKQRKK